MKFGGKIEKIYWAAKGVFVSLAAVYVYAGWHRHGRLPEFILLFSAYIVINLVMLLLNSKTTLKSERILFSLFGFDTIFLTLAVMLDGGAGSELFLGYYVMVGLLSVYMTAKKVATVALLFSLSYMTAAIVPFRQEMLLTILMRVFYIWLLGGIGYLVAHHMKASEKRLLKTLDTLNERTWELESSQVLLENMYETTKVLSAIVDLEQLFEQVLEIADKLLRVRKCAILLLDSSSKNLNLHAELQSGKKTLYNPPLVVSDFLPAELSLIGSERGKMVARKRPFDLELPLISHGKLLGILQIEAPRHGDISEKDRRSLIIFANSTAIAIDNAKMHKKMQDLTIIDELTGLYNYRYFRNKLFDEMRRADRYHQKMSLLMLDIDHFKELNDSQGHQTGNIVLQEIAAVIKQAVRDVDIVARYGGEEFMIILPQTDADNARMIAERIRSQIDQSFFSNSQGQRHIKATISIGIAVYPNGSLSATQLLEKVDKALYLAKNRGRNRVCMVSDSQAEAVVEKK